MDEVTLLQHAKDTCPQTVTAGQLATLIRGDSWPPGYRPVLLVQGVFEDGLRQQDLSRLSGLSMAVFPRTDGSRVAELREEARADPHTLLLSATGEGGLLVVFPYELDTGFEVRLQRQFYRKAFLYGNDYYEQLLCAESVRKGPGAGLRCELAHDGDAYYNPQAEPFLAWEVKEGCRRQSSRQKSTKGLRGRKPNYREDCMSQEEIEDYLRHHIELRRNVITTRREFRWLENDAVEGTGPWQNFIDETLNTLWRRMEKVKPTNDRSLRKTVESEFVPDFHPFRAYLDSLPPWDGDDHILALSATVSVAGTTDDQIMFYQCLKKWLVGMIAGWLDEHTVNEVVLVLVGAQGIYKTTWMRALLPPLLRSYFYTRANVGRSTRDSRQVMTQFGLICCEELDVMTPRDMNDLKADITTAFFDDRPAYGRYTEHRAHIASFCGTGNNLRFLNDPTGTRRWLPFKVERITSPRDLPFNYEGIYAQAYHLWQEGFDHWFGRTEIEQLYQHNRRFQVASLERQLVRRFYRQPAAGELMECVDVGAAMLTISGSIGHKLSKENVDQAFRDLGFQEMELSDGDYGFLAVRRKPEEINMLGQNLASEVKEKSF